MRNLDASRVTLVGLNTQLAPAAAGTTPDALAVGQFGLFNEQNVATVTPGTPIRVGVRMSASLVIFSNGTIDPAQIKSAEAEEYKAEVPYTKVFSAITQSKLVGPLQLLLVARTAVSNVTSGEMPVLERYTATAPAEGLTDAQKAFAQIREIVEQAAFSKVADVVALSGASGTPVITDFDAYDLGTNGVPTMRVTAKLETQNTFGDFPYRYISPMSTALSAEITSELASPLTETVTEAVTPKGTGAEVRYFEFEDISNTGAAGSYSRMTESGVPDNFSPNAQNGVNYNVYTIMYDEPTAGASGFYRDTKCLRLAEETGQNALGTALDTVLGTSLAASVAAQEVLGAGAGEVLGTTPPAPGGEDEVLSAEA